MRYPKIVEQLQAGNDVTLAAHGNSMTPIIKSGQRVTLSPLSGWAKPGDVVLAKVNGRYFIHKVTSVGSDGRYLISNNHGHDNGWTKAVYGIVTAVS